MKRTLLGFLAVIGILASFAPQPVYAATAVYCFGDPASGTPGPRRIVNPNTTTAYTLNNNGCAAFAQADVPWVVSQGGVPGPNVFSVIKQGITAQDFVSLAVPAGAYIHQIVVVNTTANAVTGGIKIGTTAGGTDVVAALTCGANCLTWVADAALLKRSFSTTLSQQLSIDAVTAWNSASVDVTVIYSLF